MAVYTSDQILQMYGSNGTGHPDASSSSQNNTDNNSSSNSNAHTYTSQQILDIYGPNGSYTLDQAHKPVPGSADPNAKPQQPKSFRDILGGAVKQIGSDAIAPIKQAGVNLKNDVTSAANAMQKSSQAPTLAGKITGAVKAGANSAIQTVGDVAGGFIQTVGGQKLIEHSVQGWGDVLSKLVPDNIAMSAPVTKLLSGDQKITGNWQDFAAKNPNKAKDIEALANVAGLLIGNKASTGKFDSDLPSVSDVAKGVASGAKETYRMANTSVADLAKEQNPLTAEKAFDVIRPKLTAKEAEDVFAKGQGEIKGRGIFRRTVINPSKSDLEVADAVKGVVDPKSTAVENIKLVKNKISDIAENEVSPFLKENPGNFTSSDVKEYIDSNVTPTRQFAKKLNPETYARFADIKDQAVDIINDSFKKNGVSTDSLWKARQKIDDAIEDQFGSAAFDSPEKKITSEAAVKIRNSINKFIEQSIPGRNMEVENKIGNFIKTARQKGITIDENNINDAVKQLRNAFTDQKELFNYEDTKGALFTQKMDEMTNLYKAKDDYLAPRAAKEPPTAYGRFKQNHGILRSTFGLGTAIGLGEGVAEGGKALIGKLFGNKSK